MPVPEPPLTPSRYLLDIAATVLRGGVCAVVLSAIVGVIYILIIGPEGRLEYRMRAAPMPGCPNVSVEEFMHGFLSFESVSAQKTDDYLVLEFEGPLFYQHAPEKGIRRGRVAIPFSTRENEPHPEFSDPLDITPLYANQPSLPSSTQREEEDYRRHIHRVCGREFP